MKKMIYLGLAALMLGLLSTACVDQIVPDEPIVEEQQVEEGALRTITATFEPNATKTSLVDGTKVYWQTGDKIRVFNAATPGGKEYTLVSGAGESTATFQGKALSSDTGPFFAIYPASAALGLASTSVEVTIPEGQKYAENSFGPGANISWAMDASSMDNFSFKNAGGALKLLLTGSGTIDHINVYTLAPEPLNGVLSINLTNPLSPSYSIKPGTASDHVMLDCGTSGVTLGSAAKAFYIMLPPGVFTQGFQVEIIDKDGKGMLMHTTKNNEIERNMVRAMPEFGYVPTYNSMFLESYAFAGAWGGVKTATISGQEYIDQDLLNDPTGQYALIPGTPKGVRFQSWKKGYAITLMPSTGTLTFLSALTLDVKAQGSTGSVVDQTALGVSVIKKSGGRSWLYDATNGTGYVITDAMIQ